VRQGIEIVAALETLPLLMEKLSQEFEWPDVLHVQILLVNTFDLMEKSTRKLPRQVNSSKVEFPADCKRASKGVRSPDES
jgi:hypothetical protein